MSFVLDVNATNWNNEVMQSETLVVVDFWHKQCIWCNALEQLYNEIAGEYGGKVKFTKLNVLESSENQRIAVTYGVMGTPTLVFFCAGRPVASFVGFQPKERLKQIVEEMIDKHRECITKSTESMFL